MLKGREVLGRGSRNGRAAWLITKCLGLIVILSIGFGTYPLLFFAEKKPPGVQYNGIFIDEPLEEVELPKSWKKSDDTNITLLKANIFEEGKIKKQLTKGIKTSWSTESPIDKAPITIHPDLSNKVIRSLELLSRRWHDRRVKDLIGLQGEKVESNNLTSRFVGKQSDRDFDESPITIRRWKFSGDVPCPVPCKTCSSEQCDVDSWIISMENGIVSTSRRVLGGNTKLTSLVPVPYFSWHDFGLMELTRTQEIGVSAKTQKALAAAFVSNCAFSKRNKMIRSLQNYIPIDSYGSCEHNKNEEHYKSRGASKISLLQTYKFSLAFENSETVDYVTEKFWESLVAGAVPVVIGAPNIKFWAPDTGPYPYTSKALIWAGDFDFDAKKLAEHLKYLDSNDTAYLEYLQWKNDGYSDDFKALGDLTAVHTTCRGCIVAGDWIRAEQGPNVWERRVSKFVQSGTMIEQGKVVFLRQRGMFKFIEVILREASLSALVEAALSFLPIKKFKMWLNNAQWVSKVSGSRVYAIYNKQYRTVIHSDIAVKEMPEGVELEVIFV